MVGRVLLAHSSRVQPTMVGNAWHQVLEVAAHVTWAARKQKQEVLLLSSFSLYSVQDPRPQHNAAHS